MFSSLVNPSDSDISFDHYRQLPLDKERMKQKSSKNSIPYDPQKSRKLRFSFKLQLLFFLHIVMRRTKLLFEDSKQVHRISFQE